MLSRITLVALAAIALVTAKLRSAGSAVAVRPTGTPACSKVVHIGDSTSVNAGPYLEDAYRSAGFSKVVIDHQGGRSLHEHTEPKENGVQVAKRLAPKHPGACWVIMLGTNDAANIAVGGVPAALRISRMMEAIGNAPTLWVDTRTLRTEGPYANANMQSWNAQLHKELQAYPNARVYQWSRVVQPTWFSDGIHYNKTGSQQRAALTAAAARR